MMINDDFSVKIGICINGREPVYFKISSGIFEFLQYSNNSLTLNNFLLALISI